MTPSDAYARYHEFVGSSDIFNRILCLYPQIRQEQGEEFYACAMRFNHLMMFLARIMAFEGFINHCLIQSGFSVDAVAKMGCDVKQKVGYLAPRVIKEPRWRDELLCQVQAELQLRHAWMHGCGNDSLIRNASLKRIRIPQSVLDHDSLANQDWITGAVWSETATLLDQLVDRIAEEQGVSITR